MRLEVKKDELAFITTCIISCCKKMKKNELVSWMNSIDSLGDKLSFLIKTSFPEMSRDYFLNELNKIGERF